MQLICVALGKGPAVVNDSDCSRAYRQPIVARATRPAPGAASSKHRCPTSPVKDYAARKEFEKSPPIAVCYMMQLYDRTSSIFRCSKLFPSTFGIHIQELQGPAVPALFHTGLS